jgi:hypothetical protein
MRPKIRRVPSALLAAAISLLAATAFGSAPVIAAGSTGVVSDVQPIMRVVQLAADGTATVQIGNMQAEIRSFDDSGRPVDAAVGLIQRATKDGTGRAAEELVWQVATGTAGAASGPGGANVMTMAAYEQGGCNPDPSYSINGCIYEDFYLKDDGTVHYANVYAVKERWTRTDPTAVLVSSSGNASSFGRTCTGVWPQHTQPFSLSSIASGRTYTHSIPWNVYVQLLSPYSYTSANVTLHWRRGTANYNFQIAWTVTPMVWPFYDNC